jgi:hypothetical protein
MEETGMRMLEAKNRQMREKYPPTILYLMVLLITVTSIVENLVMITVELFRLIHSRFRHTILGR